MNDQALSPTSKSEFHSVKADCRLTAEGHGHSSYPPSDAALRQIIRLLATIVADELLAEQGGGTDLSNNLKSAEPTWPEKE